MTSALLTDSPPMAPVSFPAGYDPAEIIRPLRHSLWRQLDRAGRPVWTPDGAAYRRAMTSRSPVHFALTYLGPYLIDQGNGQISFAEIHFAMADAIAEAAAPGPTRHAFVGARDTGKSTWCNLIGPAFLLAHRYRTFFHLFSLTDPQALGKYARIVDLLHGRGWAGRQCAPLLLADFPHLRPLRGAGGPGRTVLEGGGIVAARGLGANTLGEVVEASRPDVIAIDDPQPKESRNTLEIVAKAKSDIRTLVLPMNDRAAVWLTGTVTMPGDLFDDVVRLARGEPARGGDHGRWLVAERFTCHYHPANWPQRWSPEQLAGERAADLHTYALAREPHLLSLKDAERRFTPDMWCRDPRFPTAHRILSIDPAVTKRVTGGRTPDFTAITVLGCDAANWDVRGRGRVVVEHAEQGHYDIPDTRGRIFDLCEVPGQRIRPTVVLWGKANGGENLAQQLHPLPAGVQLVTYRESAPKHVRIEALHAQVKRRAVWLAGSVPAFETQAESWTRKAVRDDVLDAVAAGERWYRTGTADM